jgi:Flp pilus assembly pilin Flp
MRGVWLGPPLSEGLSLGEDQERLAAYTVEPHRLDSRLRLHNIDRIAKIARWLRGSAGQTMAEYALLIAVVAVVVIVAATLLGGNVSSTLHSTANHL